MKIFVDFLLIVWLAVIMTAWIGVFYQPQDSSFTMMLLLSMLVWGIIAGVTYYNRGWRVGNGGLSDLSCMIFLNMVLAPITMAQVLFRRAYRGGGPFFPAP